jgi:hypothetical protein
MTTTITYNEETAMFTHASDLAFGVAGPAMAFLNVDNVIVKLIEVDERPQRPAKKAPQRVHDAFKTAIVAYTKGIRALAAAGPEGTTWMLGVASCGEFITEEEEGSPLSE